MSWDHLIDMTYIILYHMYLGILYTEMPFRSPREVRLPLEREAATSPGQSGRKAGQPGGGSNSLV